MAIRICAVARNSLQKIPSNMKSVADISDEYKRYHLQCYRLFTDENKIERGKTSLTKSDTGTCNNR